MSETTEAIISDLCAQLEKAETKNERLAFDNNVLRSETQIHSNRAAAAAKRIAELEAANAQLRAAINFAVESHAIDWLNDWNEGHPQAMTQLNEWIADCKAIS